MENGIYVQFVTPATDWMKWISARQIIGKR